MLKYLTLISLLLWASSNILADDKISFENAIIQLLKSDNPHDTAAVKSIIRSNKQYLINNNDQANIVRWITALGRPDILEALAAVGYDLIGIGSTNNSLMLFAALTAREDPISIMHFWFNRGLNPSKAKVDDLTLIYAAIENDNLELLNLIKKHLKKPEQLYSPENIFAAVKANNVALVSQILQKSSSIDIVDHEGNSPLLLAIYKKRSLDIIQMLLISGYDLFQANKYGHTPTSFVADYPELQQMLMKSIRVDLQNQQK